MDRPNAEAELPIDINYQKLTEWLVRWRSERSSCHNIGSTLAPQHAHHATVHHSRYTKCSLPTHATTTKRHGSRCHHLSRCTPPRLIAHR